MIFKSLKWKDNFFQVFWSIFCRFSQFLLCYFFTSCTIISALFLSIAIKIKLNACVFHFQNCHSNQLNLIERWEKLWGGEKNFFALNWNFEILGPFVLQAVFVSKFHDSLFWKGHSRSKLKIWCKSGQTCRSKQFWIKNYNISSILGLKCCT